MPPDQQQRLAIHLPPRLIGTMFNYYKAFSGTSNFVTNQCAYLRSFLLLQQKEQEYLSFLVKGFILVK